MPIMAKYIVKHTCGHESILQLYGKEKDRRWRIENETTKICWDCQKTQQKQDAENAAEKNGYPELIGSEKQIAWAMTIRAKYLQKHGDIPPLLEKTSAKWWIDNRDVDYEIIKIVNDYEKTQKMNESKNAFLSLTKSEIFKKIHAMTKKMMAKFSDIINYRAQFAINLRAFYAERKLLAAA